MAEHRVLVTDYTWADTSIERGVLDEVGAEVVEAPTGDEAELVGLVSDCDAILTCFAQVTPAVVRAGPRLRVIGRYGIGTDNIAVDVATERGIPVTNVPEYCSDEVAEHVLAMILSLVRGLHRYDRAIREGDWSLTTGLPTRRIAGSTLGIVGHGPIGRALERRARASGWRSSSTPAAAERPCASWPRARTSSRCTCRPRRRPRAWSTRHSFGPCSRPPT